MSNLGMRVRIWGHLSLFRELAYECDVTKGTRRWCVCGVGVASDDGVDCSGHFGAKSPTDDTRLACRLLGRVEKQGDVAVPAALCGCGDAGIGELPCGNRLEASSRSVSVLCVSNGGRTQNGLWVCGGRR